MKLKQNKGFTLVELLVVIAIIGILLAIVIVFINPVERIRRANDNRAASNLRTAAAAIAACTTSELRLGAPGFPFGPESGANADPFTILDSTSSPTQDGCGNFTWMSAAGRQYTTSSRPAGITIWNNGSANPTRLCMWIPGGNPGGTNNWWVYSSSRQQARSVTSNPATLNSCSTTFDSL